MKVTVEDAIVRSSDEQQECVGNKILPQCPQARGVNERTETTEKNACKRETMMKIRAVMTFAIAQVALA